MGGKAETNSVNVIPSLGSQDGTSSTCVRLSSSTGL